MARTQAHAAGEVQALADQRQPVHAPGGWGWPPGFLLSPVTLDDLPPPPAATLTPAARNAALVSALRGFPGLSQVRPRDLVARYNIPNVTASVVLVRAKAAGE